VLITDGLIDFEESDVEDGVDNGVGEELADGGDEGGVATEVEEFWRLDGLYVTPKLELLQNGQVDVPLGDLT
jgi:hypothetical protein